jgi:molecular chaperone DnaJ
MRLAGEGEPGLRGGPPGDLYVVLTVKPHQTFRREGEDVYLELPVTFPQAALGAELEVPTIDGVEVVSIPEGTQSGTVVKLRGKGVPRLQGGGRGDQLVVIQVVTPQKITKEQRALLEKLAAITPPVRIGEHSRERDRGFFEKLFG